MSKEINNIVLPEETMSRIHSYLSNDGMFRIKGLGEFRVKSFKIRNIHNVRTGAISPRDAVKVYFRPFVKMKRMLRDLVINT